MDTIIPFKTTVPVQTPASGKPASTARPRERLLALGAGALTDAELVAILLRTGMTGEPVETMAERLLHEFGGLQGLTGTPVRRLLDRKGLSDAKTATLLAAVEIARRLVGAAAGPSAPVTGPAQGAPLLLPLFVGLEREAFAVLFLDARHRPLGAEILFHGTMNQTAVYPGEIARRALRYGAQAVILAHNHPSGDLSPSAEDRSLTRKVEEGLKLLDIKLLDHLIIHGERWQRMNTV